MTLMPITCCHNQCEAHGIYRQNLRHAWLWDSREVIRPFQAQRDANQPPTTAEFVSDYEATTAIRARKRFTLQGLVDLAMGTRRILKQIRSRRWKRTSENEEI